MKISFAKLEEAYQKGVEGYDEPRFLWANEDTLKAIISTHWKGIERGMFNAAQMNRASSMPDGYVVFINFNRPDFMSAVDAREEE